MGAIKEVLVPDIGDFKDVPVIEILVKPGDEVAADASVVTLESDKATMEVPTPHAGVVRDVRVKVGDKVAQGTLLLTVEAVDAQVDAVPPRMGRPLSDGERKAVGCVPGSGVRARSP